MRRRLIVLTVYAVTMACLEAAVVVYLRAIYYPQGFSFPLVLIPPDMGAIEIGREAATIVMLLAVAALAGGDRWEKFLFFAVSFGVWDVFYYVWLWILIRWPPSLLTWDVLFLIPVPWIAPVLAPVAVSTGLILGSGLLLRLRARGVRLEFPWILWAAAVAGGALVLLSFTIDFRTVLEQRPPPPFRWGLFTAGVALGTAALAIGIRRISRGAGGRRSG